MNKYTWKKLEKLVYTVNCVCIHNVCMDRATVMLPSVFSFIFQTSYWKMIFTTILSERVCGNSLGYWPCYSHSAHPVTQHSLPSASCSGSSSKQRHFSSTLLNPSYLKATSTNWSFGKKYHCYTTDIIRLSQLALMYVAYAQGLVCSALGCSKCDSQMENKPCLTYVAPQ